MKLKLSVLLVICCGPTLAIFIWPMPANTSNLTFRSANDEAHASDRQAIRAHIDKIFQAYIDRDCDTIRATHAQNWIGFTGGARSIIHGLDEYLNRYAMST
jgi:hypothetical protein